MCRGTAFSTRLYVGPAKTQISMASVQADQSLRCRPEHALNPWLSKENPGYDQTA